MLRKSHLWQLRSLGLLVSDLNLAYAQLLSQATNKVFEPALSETQLLRGASKQLCRGKRQTANCITGAYLLVGSEVVELKKPAVGPII